MTEIAEGKKKAASKMGLMDMEGSGPSSAVKAQLPPAVSSSPPPELVIPEIEFPDSETDFEVRWMLAYTWLIGSDSGGQADGPRRTRHSRSQPDHSKTKAKTKAMAKSKEKERSLSQPVPSSASERPNRRTASQVRHYRVHLLKKVVLSSLIGCSASAGVSPWKGHCQGLCQWQGPQVTFWNVAAGWFRLPGEFIFY